MSESGVSVLLKEVRNLAPDSGVAAILRAVVESARVVAGSSFAAIVPLSAEQSWSLITVAVDGYTEEVDTVEDIERRVRLHAGDEELLRLPISANGGEFAMLYLSGLQPDELAAAGITTELADFVAVAEILVERALLAEELTVGSQWTSALGPLPVSRFPTISNTSSFFDQLAASARRLTDTACVAIATPVGDVVEVRSAVGYHADRLRGRVVPAKESLMGQVLATLQTLEVDDAASSQDTYGPTARQVELGSTVVLPMLWADQPIGALMLGNPRGGDAVDVGEVLAALGADPQLRAVLGLDGAAELTVPLMRLKGSPDWDWRFDSLANRELVVLNLLGEGLSNAEIAERLFLSHKTVRNYVSNTLTKLGMRRVEAAVLAARLLAQLPPAERP